MPFHGNRLERPHSGGLVALERMAVDIVASAESRGCVVVNAIFDADSKNVARRFCSNRNGAVSCSQDRIAHPDPHVD